ncbi:hypothetical protein [Owenweeksia hongkongensis]|uniref:hypothetical protein n=1 Tax=Owenweeksia hongkongensis TaxID=253245 RepID=UPI003A90507E
MTNIAAFKSYADSPNYPQKISELTPAQWIHYLMLLSRYSNQEISIQDFKVEWLAYLTRMSSFGASRMRVEEMINSEEYSLDGFVQHLDGVIEINTFTVTNNLPQYTWNNIRYTGPQDLCFNLSFGQFLTAYYVFQDYALTQNPIALKYLFAVLYSDGSPLYKRVEALEDIPNYVALSAYYFFKSVVSHIHENPVYVAGEDLPLYRVFEEAAKKSDVSNFGMEEALYDIAYQSGVTIDRDNLKNQNLYEVLRYVWFRIKAD